MSTGLYRIVCREPVDGTAKPDFELHMKQLESEVPPLVMWGSAPGREQPGEAPARIKVAHLLDYLRDGGSLEGKDVDLRSGAVIISPRVARPPSESLR